jgi:acetyl-CoA C-acetyltransferase
MKDVAVVSYCRTGIAKAGRGALNQTHGIPMAAHVLRNAVKRAQIDPGEVEDVILGCGLPEGATGHNIARNAALEAGFGGTPDRAHDRWRPSYRSRNGPA